jgi:hypothetical protein
LGNLIQITTFVIADPTNNRGTRFYIYSIFLRDFIDCCLCGDALAVFREEVDVVPLATDIDREMGLVWDPRTGRARLIVHSSTVPLVRRT